ncbi:MAG TPA: DegT/DnrJ/EryC1/StrS family aminotransferase [Ktedonobacteraceae bacterium]|nr:DegT/DnrJ/EryC1/StrS family aminotransferase [Ktedonobacteraceae bacterium]
MLQENTGPKTVNGPLPPREMDSAVSAVSPIPAEDVSRQYHLIAREIGEAIDRVLPSGRYVLGPELTAFEQEYAAFCGTRSAIGISNGTDALHLALLACGIGPGDEVITVPNTYIATVFAITYVGATPVFVDVEPDTYNMNPLLLEEAITERTRAIIPVHLYGQPCDMQPILAIARRHGLRVIEDAAHAHGASYHDAPAGSFGDISCFSFYPTKTFGAFGDAGAIVTNDAALDERVRQLRYMGQKVKHHHEMIGYQKRMDEIQAAILRVKLRYLSRWIARRQEVAARYRQLLADLEDVALVLPSVAPDRRHAYYLYTVLAPQRDELRAYLTEHEIGTQIIYPVLVPDQPAYRDQHFRCGSIPVARRLLEQILCLPMFPELRDDEIERVSAVIHDFYNRLR